MPKVNALKGFKDLLPGESERWEWVASVARQTFQAFGFSLIRTPILEREALFTRSIGEATDIVEKEMYTFDDWDRKPITLRPEGTASVVRNAVLPIEVSFRPIFKKACRFFVKIARDVLAPTRSAFSIAKRSSAKRSRKPRPHLFITFVRHASIIFMRSRQDFSL